MIDLAHLSPIAGLVTVPARHPRYANRVRRQFASLGVNRIIALINTPDDAEFLALSAIADNDNRVVLYDTPPPAHFTGLRGSWYQTLAWRDLIQTVDRSGAESVLILEDDALLTAEAVATLALAELPDDWDCLYLGAMHEYGVTEQVDPHVLRIFGSKANHAVVYHRRAFKQILSWPLDRPSDQLLADHLHPQGRSYALWPQVCVQLPGLSVITGEMSGEASLWTSRGQAAQRVVSE